MQESIEKSRNTTFVSYVVAMDIPLIGRTAGRALDSFFRGNLQEFVRAAVSDKHHTYRLEMNGINMRETD